MKKLLIITGLVVAGMTINAQNYLGGSLNFSINATKADNGDKKTTTTNWGYFPEVGYYISDKWDIGIELGGGQTIEKNHAANNKTKTSNWLFSPFTRYSLIQAGGFELIGKGSLIITGSNTFTNYGLQITPVVAYNLNDKIALQANLNFASFGVSRNKIKDGGDSATNLNLGVNTNNLATIGDLTIGFIYKF